jgi:hypothetical protein
MARALLNLCITPEEDDLMIGRRYGIGIAASSVLLLTSMAQAQTTPEQSCRSGKNKVAGKYAACRQSTEAKLVTSGDTVKYDAAIIKCETKFTTSWLKLDTKAAAHAAACPDAPLTVAQFQTAIDQHSASIGTALAGGGLSDCPADLATCTSDLASCNTTLGVCGNLVKDGVEACDGSDLGGASCTDFGFGGGPLTCDASCKLVVGACTPATLCGNASVDGGEQCDQSNLNGGTCATQGFTGGILACGAGCAFDTTACFSGLRLVDNGDGTITDRQTALTWEKKVKLDATADYANPRDADNDYAWAGTCTIATTKYCQPTAAAAAACLAGVDGPATGCTECNGGSEGTCGVARTVWTFLSDLNGVGLGGHGDWRIPTRGELEGIVDYADTSPPMVDIAFHGSSCGGSCTNPGLPACGCTQYAPYWEASTFANPSTDAFYADFNDGTTNLSDELNLQFIRAVRTNP